MTLWLVDEFGHGGIGRYAVDVANLVGDATPTVVATSALGPVGGLLGSSTQWFPRLSESAYGKAAGGVIGVCKAARQVRPDDVVWLPLGIRPTFELALAGVLRARGARLVATIHNRGPHGHGESPTVVRAARWAEAVVVHTDDLESWARGRGLAAVRLPFPPPDVRGTDGSTSRAALGIPDDQLVLSVLGYLHDYKGVDVLLAAYAEARRRAPGLPVHLLLAGRLPRQGAVVAALERFRRTPGLTVRPGWLQEAELSSLLDLTDVVALPYKEIDNSGSGALARSRRLPALATDLPGLRTIFGDAALYVRPDDVDGLTEALLRLPDALPALRARAAGHRDDDLRPAYRSFAAEICGRHGDAC